MREGFYLSSIDLEFHADTAGYCITLGFPKGTALEDGDGTTKCQEVVDAACDHGFIELNMMSFQLCPIR